MNRERAFLLQILAALLVYSSLAWSQEFGTNVVGSASACGTNKYSQSGPLDSSGLAESRCPPPSPGQAVAQSQADLNTVSAGTVAVDKPASGNAAALTFDTVTLIPPLGFNGTSVKFTFVDTYATDITKFAGSGSVKMCWTLSGLLGHCVTSTNGKGGGTLKAQLTLMKSKNGFQFKVTKTMGAAASGSVSASFVTGGEPNFILPQGWTCTFASGVGCI